MLTAIVSLLSAQVHAIGKTTITAFGSYWNTEDPGKGAGLKVGKSLIDILFLKGSISTINFEEADLDMIPMEASLNIGLPGILTPYAGIGVGYYHFDSDHIDDKTGYFAQAGLELSIALIGAMAEVRYHDIEGTALDEFSVNAGILLKF